jgi:hypothetical protein
VNGYLRFRHWRVYGERGLAGYRGAARLFGEELSVTYKEELLAQYQVRLAPDGRHLQAVQAPKLFPNRYPSRQGYLPGLEGDWPLAVQLPAPAPYRPRSRMGRQQALAFS